MARPIKHGHNRIGKISTTYRSWSAMKSRCNNPNNNKYEMYGGAGIKVCLRWIDFENFLEDMGERPEGTTLDRIDGTKNYTPDNCRWSTIVEQNNNRKQMKKFSTNTSGYTGIYYDKSKNRWKVDIRINGKRIRKTCISFEEAINFIN